MLKSLILVVLLLAFLPSCSTQVSKQDSSEKASLEKKKKVINPQALAQMLEAKTNKLIEEGSPEKIEFAASDLFLKANDASMRGESELASLLFHYTLKLKPEDLFLKKKLVVEFIRQGNLAEAKELLEGVVDKEIKDDPTMALVLAGVYTADSQSTEARKVYQNILKHHPENEEACVFLAKNYSGAGTYKKAFKLLRTCEKRLPKAAIFPYYRGKIYLSQDNFKKARVEFKHALKVDPNYHQAALALGLMLEEKQKYSQAIKHYREYLNSDESEKESFTILSRLVQLMFAAKQYKEVIPYAEKLVYLDPEDVNLKVRLGILYSDVKRVDEAIEMFKEVLVVVPSSDKVLYYLGSLYQQTGKLENSIETFLKIPEESSLFHDGTLQVAQMLQAMAVHDQSEKWEEKFFSFINEGIEKHEPIKVDLSLLKASYLEGEFKVSQAADTMEKVKEHKNFDESHYYYLASLYDKLKKRDQAIAIVRKILNKNPENAHALNFLGYTLLEGDENLEEAFSLISKAVSLRPDDGYILDSLGWYHFKTGDYQKALKKTLQARKLVDDDVVISKHLALIYKKLNDVANARKYYLEALRHCRYDSEKQEVIKELGDIESLRLPASSSASSLVAPQLIEN